MAVTAVTGSETGTHPEVGDGDADNPKLAETGEIAQPISSALIPLAMARMALDHIYAAHDPDKFPIARLEIVLGLARLPKGTSDILDFPFLELGPTAVQDIADLHSDRSALHALPPSYDVSRAYEMEIFARTPIDEETTLG